MSKEKQIEEMIEAIKPFVSGFACGEESGSCELTDCRTCKARNLANGIYNAGYRKQIGWISVDDRLPESEQMVLCFTPCDGFMFVGYYQEVKPNPYWKSYWNIITAMRSTKKITKKVTHWMPLPEPPMMKGGE